MQYNEENLIHLVAKLKMLGYTPFKSTLEGVDILIKDNEAISVIHNNVEAHFDDEVYRSCKALNGKNLTVFGGSNMEYANELFYDSLNGSELLDLSRFDSSKLCQIPDMFECCWVKHINLSGFITSEVFDMARMFRDTENLEELDLSSFDTHNVEDFRMMFDTCYAKTINLSTSFTDQSAVDMCYMFSDCKAEEIILPGFTGAKAEEMIEMFSGCQSKIIDIRNMKISKDTDIKDIFKDCLAEEIIVNDERLIAEIKRTLKNVRITRT